MRARMNWMAGATAALLATGYCPLLGQTSGDTASSLPPPRDPRAALAEEYAARCAMGTNAALIGFIARHPRSDLAERARAALAERPRPDPAPGRGPDARVQAAFDAARIEGTPEAMAAFAARYDGHPLAKEARNPLWLR
jgi:hypothetical protein